MSDHPGTARERVIDAAVELFAEHGVQGTSLRMIADRLGVAKGAVYYQFHSKDDLVLALLRPMFDGIAALADRLAALPPGARRQHVAVSGLVDLAVDQRRASCLLRRDPVVEQMIAENDELRGIAERFKALVLGQHPDDAARVALSVAVTGLYFCTTDPALRHVPDAQLREILLRRSLLCVSVPVPPTAIPPMPAATQPGAALRDSAPCR
ncbi:TetR/AcrR family transcriptional regulator [Mycobacterium sp. NPDC003323]